MQKVTLIELTNMLLMELTEK